MRKISKSVCPGAGTPVWGGCMGTWMYMFRRGVAYYGINRKFIKQYQQSGIRRRRPAWIRRTGQWSGSGYADRVHDLRHPGKDRKTAAEETDIPVETGCVPLRDR